MSEPLDERYFVWLYGQVASVEERNPSRTYWNLMRKLFLKEFIWIIPNDDNRMEDGRDLRREFIDDERITDVDPTWFQFGCCMLELLIGLSRRLAFECEGEPYEWFWLLIENLKLEGFNDHQRLRDKYVDDVLDQVIFRTYRKNGQGGLFPLKKAQMDQREVELWYQLSAYVLERAS